jgi:CubicO group peptidase (beta-lactamase class C family)
MTGFPPQPSSVPWPTLEWPTGPIADTVDQRAVYSALRYLGSQPPEVGQSLATLVVHRGRLVAEQYASSAGPDEALVSWSIAKSVMHAVVGLLVGRGQLITAQAAPVDAWSADERRRITIQQLLTMRSGLRFVEDYVDESISNCIEMLFGAGHDDVAAYAAAQPLEHPPGEVWNYSSGTTNILSRIAGDVVGGGEGGMRMFLNEHLFGPLGMRSADPRFDGAGTFISSSFLYATARDFARFGYLYLRGGVWEGRPLLPEGWAEHARTPTPVPETEEFGYGAHWWLWPEWPGTFGAHGYEGQYVVVCPDRDLVVVQLSKNVAEDRPNLLAPLEHLIEAFPSRR